MSASPLYSSTALTTIGQVQTASPSPSLSSTTTISASWSPISSSPMWSATLLPTAEYTAYAARSPIQSPSAALPLALLSPSLTPQTSQVTSPTNSGITVGDLSAVCIVLGGLLFVSMVYAIHYNNKYKKEKIIRSTDIRSNPMHSQLRSILPN